MKELKIQKSAFSESKSYSVLYKKELASLKGFSPANKRNWMEAWKNGFQKAAMTMPDWFEDMPPFLDPEYRIHPLMGHQVRSRHKFEPEVDLQQELIRKTPIGKIRNPKIIPYELNPEYREKGEKEHKEGDLKGVKQYPVTLEDERFYPDPSFSHIKSARLRRSGELLKFKIGYDHKTNKHVLYSPFKYDERWDQQSQVLWLRVIGMSPKRISIKLKIKIDTVKNWLRVLKGQPLVNATQYDWSIRQVDDKAEVSSKHSSIEAKLRKYESGTTKEVSDEY